MDKFQKIATRSLSEFLSKQLPKLSSQWWDRNVIAKLSYQQQRITREKRINSLQQFDLAALLRIFDQNWYELSENENLPYEGRNWVKEMQSVRNRWAHQSVDEASPKEMYRDLDTLSRLTEMIETRQEDRDIIEGHRDQLLDQISGAAGGKKAPEVDQCTTRFQVGEVVGLKSNPQVLLPILAVDDSSREPQYTVFQDNKPTLYFESQLVKSSTDESVENIDVDVFRSYLTSEQLLSPSNKHLFSMKTGRVKFVPYQYRPVMKMIQSDRPRILIADEVGVGKTIEAGLVIKELKARHKIRSVLIICPKALVAERKWEMEMKRFDEEFVPLDGAALRHCIREADLEGEWLDRYSKCIIPFSILDSRALHGNSSSKPKEKGLLDLDPPPQFDLVIVDEAHNIRNPSTQLHQAVKYFTDHAQAAIFLSATPVQLGSNDLYTLLNILRPDLIIDEHSFHQMSEPNPLINEAIKACRSVQDDWQDSALSLVEDVAQTSWGRGYLAETSKFQEIADELGSERLGDEQRVTIIRKLEELYTFSSLINRTRRRDIGEFTLRKSQTVSVSFTEQQQDIHDRLLALIARILEQVHGRQNVNFMMTTLRRQAASCIYGLAPAMQNVISGNLSKLSDSDFGEEDEFVEISSELREEAELLIEAARDLDEEDPKVDRFIDVIAEKLEMDKNKVLVFSTFRHTLSYLKERLEQEVVRFGLIHGDVPDSERASLRQRFKLDKEDEEAIDVLLSSEVGCEGLDFQHCDMIMNYDLPWNPMKIEQRIGRIDRYGQESEAISIINMITPDTVDADIYNRCLVRIGVFEHAIGGSETILGDLTCSIRSIAENYDLTAEERAEKVQQLADNKIRQIQEESALEDKEADLFGLQLPKKDWQEKLEEAQSYWLSPAAIQGCVSNYLEDVTGETKKRFLGNESIKTLRLSKEVRQRLLEDFRKLDRENSPSHRRWEKWLRSSEPTINVTFESESASEEPEVVYLNILHPLVKQAAEHFEISNDSEIHLHVEDETLPKGNYSFLIHKWRKTGLTQDDSIVITADNEAVEEQLLDLVARAANAEGQSVPSNVLRTLEEKHYEKWSKNKADHKEHNSMNIEQRKQSLRISHEAREKVVMDQIDQATNDKIVTMKISELSRIQSSHSESVKFLNEASDQADLHVTKLIQGTLKVN